MADKGKTQNSRREATQAHNQRLQTDIYKNAREACMLLHNLIERPSKNLKDINKVRTEKELLEMLLAMQSDLRQLKGNTLDLVQHLSGLPCDKDSSSKEEHKQSTGKNVTGAAKAMPESIEENGICLWVQLREAVKQLENQLDKQEKQAVNECLWKIDTSKLISECGTCQPLKKQILQIGKDVKKQKSNVQEERELVKSLLEDEKQHLESSIKAVQERFTWLTDSLQRLRRENQQMLIDKENLESANRKLKKDLKHRDASDFKPHDYVTLTLDNQTAEIKRLKENLHQTEMRLAAEMGSKVASDESSLENISIKTRPMNITSEYEQFCGHSWLTTKTFLDDKIKEKEDEKLQFLTAVLMVSETQAGHHFIEVKQWILAMLQEPVEVKFNPSAVKVDKILKDKNLSKDETYITDKFRMCAEDVKLEYLEKIIRADVNENMKKYKNCQKVFKGKQADEYVRDCARLTWKMVIQRPPMRFETEKTIDWKGNDRVVEPAWGSNAENKKAVIQFYRHPTLYHGKAVMVKGKAIIK